MNQHFSLKVGGERQDYPSDRLADIAAILAKGILRLPQALKAEPKVASEIGQNLTTACLENSGKTRLNVTRPGTDAVPKKASRRGAEDTTPALTTTTL